MSEQHGLRTSAMHFSLVGTHSDHTPLSLRRRIVVAGRVIHGGVVLLKRIAVINTCGRRWIVREAVREQALGCGWGTLLRGGFRRMSAIAHELADPLEEKRASNDTGRGGCRASKKAAAAATAHC